MFRREATLSSREPRHDAFVIPASLKLNTLDVPTKCWHANRPRVFERRCRERTNRAIAQIAGRIEEEAIARRIEVPSDSMPRAAHLLSSDLTAYLVEEVVQFFPWYLGLHPAGIPRVKLPRRLFISTLRGRD